MTIEIPNDIQALIFDCDGTLADTMPLHYRAWVQMYGEYGHPFAEDLFYRLGGVPTSKIIEQLNAENGWDVPVQIAHDRKEALYVELIHEVRPIEEVVDVVRRYHGKLPMAVATGGVLSVASKTLIATGLMDYFQTIVTADDVEHGKPAPDIFLEAARRLHVPSEKCWAFEDADMGIESARRAGMHVVDIRPLRRR